MVSRLFGDSCFHSRQQLFGEAFAERLQDIFFRREIEIESAFGNLGAGGDLFDGGVRDAIFEEEVNSGLH